MNDKDEPLVDDPQIDLAAESFDTDTANFTMGEDAEAVIGEADATEDLVE